MNYLVSKFKIVPSKRLLFFALFFIGSLTAAAQINDAPVEALIPHAPAFFKGSDNRFHAEYEIHLTNFYESTGPLIIKSLSVYGDASKSPIAVFAKEDLLKLLNFEEMPKTGTNLDIAPGKRTVLFLWLTIKPGEPLPKSLHHVIDFADSTKQIHTLNCAKTRIDQRPVLALGAPLHGHMWFVDEGPGNPKSHHWGSMLAQNGVVTVPQRFAIDFFGLNDAGHAIEAQPDKLNQTNNKQWIGYGTEVFAVQDGIIKDLRDGIADHAPLAPLPQPTEITARGVYGNFVVLEIAPGIYAHYAHLQNNSIRVKIGQHVKKGDVLGYLGDSGNAGGPHLHFHISDKPTFELSEGVPYVISTFNVVGITDEGSMLNPASKFQKNPAAAKNALPLFGDIVQF